MKRNQSLALSKRGRSFQVEGLSTANVPVLGQGSLNPRKKKSGTPSAEQKEEDEVADQGTHTQSERDFEALLNCVFESRKKLLLLKHTVIRSQCKTSSIYAEIC